MFLLDDILDMVNSVSFDHESQLLHGIFGLGNFTPPVMEDFDGVMEFISLWIITFQAVQPRQRDSCMQNIFFCLHVK